MRSLLVRYRKWLIGAGVVLALLLVGYAVGRYAAPAKVRTEWQTKTVVQEKIVTKTDVQIKLVEVKSKDTTKARRKVTTHKPDGTVMVVEEEAEKTKEDMRTGVDLRAREEATAERKATEETKVVQTIDRFPDWMLDVGAGADVPGLLGRAAAPSVVPGMPKHVVADVSIKRRVFGSFYLGVWASSGGAVGVRATVLK